MPHHLTMTQGADMPIFRIIDSSLFVKRLKNGRQGLRMEIVLKRKIVSEMMTTYFPTLLLTTITFATTFFKPFFFEAALSVNLTTMLVMTTIFISKMEGLPPTSDIKMIDIWLVLCQMVPFAEVILLTAMEHHRADHLDNENGTICILTSSTTMIDEEQEEEDLPPKVQWKKRIKGWLPRLKTIGTSPRKVLIVE